MALQHLPAQTIGRLVHMPVGQSEFSFRVKRRISGPQAEPARRDFPDAPPLARHHAENFAHKMLRRLIALFANGAGILVLDLDRKSVV